MVAFSVEDIEGIVEAARKQGGKILQEVMAEEDDLKEFGVIKTALVQTYGETVHKLIDRAGYRGPFLPGYSGPELKVSYRILINLSTAYQLIK